jgi:hypothetical protein
MLFGRLCVVEWCKVDSSEAGDVANRIVWKEGVPLFCGKTLICGFLDAIFLRLSSEIYDTSQIIGGFPFDLIHYNSRLKI